MSAIVRFGVCRVAALAATVAATLLAAPSWARAATSCDFIASSRPERRDVRRGDGAVLRVSPGGDIVVSAGGGELVCFGMGGPASVTNTDVIQVFSQPGASANTVAIVGPSRLPRARA